GDPLGEILEVLRRGKAELGPDELVAAGPGQEFARTQAGAQPLRDDAQQLVPRMMTVDVVDLLETIEVEYDDPDLLVAAMRFSQQVRQVLGKRDAVRQAGQCIVHRGVAKA